MISGHRLRGRRAFAAVRSRHASGSAPSARVSVMENGGQSARVGFTIPRSAGGAVIRNRARRRLRAVLAPRLEQLAGLDVVVGAGVAATRVPFATLERDVDSCLAAARARLSPRGHP